MVQAETQQPRLTIETLVPFLVQDGVLKVTILQPESSDIILTNLYSRVIND